MRQIVLDTETTGVDIGDGHRIIEIGCVEIVNRRLTGGSFHCYLQPDRAIDEGAFQVHGISNEFLADKPRFPDVAQDLVDFIRDAELVIHNAPFDVGFLNHELKLMGASWGRVDSFCRILDTLVLARRMHPGQRNSLDALCKRYSIDNSHRERHGALLDAEILADVYLTMTGGQTSLSLGQESAAGALVERGVAVPRTDTRRLPLKVVKAAAEELAGHELCLDAITKASGGKCLWREREAARAVLIDGEAGD